MGQVGTARATWLLVLLVTGRTLAALDKGFPGPIREWLFEGPFRGARCSGQVLGLAGGRFAHLNPFRVPTTPGRRTLFA
jgi:hypothetical protein